MLMPDETVMRAAISHLWLGDGRRVGRVAAPEARVGPAGTECAAAGFGAARIAAALASAGASEAAFQS